MIRLLVLFFARTALAPSVIEAPALASAPTAAAVPASAVDHCGARRTYS
jgi:hypothetical protein